MTVGIDYGLINTNDPDKYNHETIRNVYFVAEDPDCIIHILYKGADSRTYEKNLAYNEYVNINIF